MDLIQILIFILFFCLLAAILLFTVRVQLNLSVGTRSLLSLTARWLNPFLQIKLQTENNGFLLSVFLFGIRVYHKTPNKRKKRSGNKKLYRSAALEDIRVNAAYHLANPYVTGITSGIGSMFSSAVPGEVRLFPDFTALDDYVEVNASAKLSLGKTLVHLMN